MDTKEAKKIAKSWGWKLDELLEALENGGTSLDPVKNISATQTAHEIITTALKRATP